MTRLVEFSIRAATRRARDSFVTATATPLVSNFITSPSSLLTLSLLRATLRTSSLHHEGPSMSFPIRLTRPRTPAHVKKLPHGRLCADLSAAARAHHHAHLVSRLRRDREHDVR